MGRIVLIGISRDPLNDNHVCLGNNKIKHLVHILIFLPSCDGDDLSPPESCIRSLLQIIVIITG